MNKAPDKDIHIKNLEDLKKNIFNLFGYRIYMTREERDKVGTELNTLIICQGNEFRIEGEE